MDVPSLTNLVITHVDHPEEDNGIPSIISPEDHRRHSVSDVESLIPKEPSRTRRASSPARPSPSLYIKAGDTPQHLWTLDVEDEKSKPVTALCAGPRRDTVFVGNKDGVTLLEHGQILIKYSSTSTQSGASSFVDKSPRARSASRASKVTRSTSPNRRSSVTSLEGFERNLPSILQEAESRLSVDTELSSPLLMESPLVKMEASFPTPQAPPLAPPLLGSPAMFEATDSTTISLLSPIDAGANLPRPQTPRGRKNIDSILRLSDKDFVGTIYFVPDEDARRSSQADPKITDHGWVLAHWTLWKVVQWEVASHKPRRVYPACTTTCIRPPFLWGACDDNTVREWDVRSGQCLRQLNVGETPTQICVSRNRFLFLSTAKEVHRWNLSSNVKEAELLVDPPILKPGSTKPNLFIDDIVMDEHGDNLYGKSPRIGIFAWDVYGKGGRASLKWPVLLPITGEESINWLFVRTKHVWVAGMRGKSNFMEEYDPIHREKLRSWKLDSLPMSMAITQDAKQAFTGHIDGSIKVWDTTPPIDTGRKGRVFKDIYG